MELAVWLALGLQPLTQLCSARSGAEDAKGAHGRHPPTSFFRKAAGLSKPPPAVSLEQDAQPPSGRSKPARHSDTVLLDEDVLVVVEPVDRHPPSVFSPMLAPPPWAVAAPAEPPWWWAGPPWALEKDEEGLTAEWWP